MITNLTVESLSLFLSHTHMRAHSQSFILISFLFIRVLNFSVTCWLSRARMNKRHLFGYLFIYLIFFNNFNSNFVVFFVWQWVYISKKLFLLWNHLYYFIIIILNL